MKYFNDKSKSDSLMNVSEVSLYLRIPRKTVYRLAKQGRIKGVKVGRHWRFLKQDIDYYLQYGRNKTTFTALSESGERSDRRSYPRINSNFKCQYSINLPPFKEIKSSGIIKDLSASGVYLFNKEIGQIDINDPIELEFILVTDNNQKVDIKTKGRVVRKVESGLGVRFKNIDKELQKKIIQYVG